MEHLVTSLENNFNMNYYYSLSGRPSHLVSTNAARHIQYT